LLGCSFSTSCFFDRGQPVGVLYFFAFTGLVPVIGASLVDRLTVFEVVADAPAVASWADSVSTHDPVLNTRHGGQLPPRVRSRTVDNRGSRISDHTVYWQNTEQFVADLAARLGTAVGFPVVASRRDFRVIRAWSRRRRWRVGMLKAARTVIAAATILAIGLASASGNLPELGMEVRQAIASVVGLLPGPLGGWLAWLVPPQGADLAVGLAGVTATGLVGYVVAARVWDAWCRRETSRMFARKATDLGGPVFLLFIALGVVVTIVVVVIGAIGSFDPIVGPLSLLVEIALTPPLFPEVFFPTMLGLFALAAVIVLLTLGWQALDRQVGAGFGRWTERRSVSNKPSPAVVAIALIAVVAASTWYLASVFDPSSSPGAEESGTTFFVGPALGGAIAIAVSNSRDAGVIGKVVAWIGFLIVAAIAFQGCSSAYSSF
jgi:hypothetical protein